MRHRDGLIHIIHSTPHLQLPHVSPTTYFLFATYAVLRQGGEKGIIMRQEGSTSPYAILQTCINTQLIHFHAQNKVWLPQTCIMRHNPLRGKETTSEPHVMSASFCLFFCARGGLRKNSGTHARAWVRTPQTPFFCPQHHILITGLITNIYLSLTRIHVIIDNTAVAFIPFPNSTVVFVFE